MVMNRLRWKNLSEQVIALRCKYPQFETSIDRQQLIVKGFLKPTDRSEAYQFVLKYNLSGSPEVRIISPALKRNSKGDKIPHMYSQKYLCLFQPKYKEFKRSDFLCDTIIPWTSLWLYFYELWHLTGKWLGGGEHPKIKIKNEKKR